MMMDGLYDACDLETAVDQSVFTDEKDLCDFIERNITEFTLELGFVYDSHKREFPLYPSRRHARGRKRLDFLITTQSGKNIALECKKPYYKSELAAGVGQILSYVVCLESTKIPIHKIVLVSSVLDAHITQLISRFSLPIEYIVMDKTKSLTWLAPKNN